jgi:hypothetical protein
LTLEGPQGDNLAADIARALSNDPTAEAFLEG